MRIVAVALGFGMLLAGSIATAKEPLFVKSAFPWVALDTLQTPSLPADIPSAAAGCLVVGHHILADGTTAKARIMQTAFTGDVTAHARAEFETAALAIVEHWRFRNNKPDGKSSANFNTVVVGFGATGAPGAARAVVGIDAQDARVQESCRIDLAEWGSRNAIPVEEARAREDKGMLLVQPGDPSSYWVGEMIPGHYPVDAVRFGAEACVVIGFRIGVDGVPGDFRIMYSSLERANSDRFLRQFEQASLRAASAWRFAPGPDNLQRFPQFKQTPMSFHLGSGATPFTCKAVDLASGDDRATQ